MDTVNKQKAKKVKKDNEAASAAASTITAASLQSVKPPTGPLFNFGQPANTHVTTAQTPAVVTTTAYSAVANEAQSAADIQIAMDSYCKVVEKRLVDIVSQTCYCQLITECALELETKLTSAFPPSELLRLMKEPQEQANRRNKLETSIRRFEQALKLGQENL
ncbi:unnamed protein product [Didymodactylos carnosus]|nr:unnamed protein product [Didymodactylos carnosus]CAF4578750.1 unnamed protein product [Didymodactylos carnosus]